MTSALRDAGIGVDGGYPVDRPHPADINPNVSIHRMRLRRLDGQNRSSWVPQTRPTSPMNPPFIR